MLQIHVISKQEISFATFALFTGYQTRKIIGQKRPLQNGVKAGHLNLATLNIEYKNIIDL